ncbi:MAG: hypothetical protein DHS20C14_21710 [Phycisphaeraceae bacterium]|nr:MAG: hypothetical protein DHS20C14_21710 [Phycisphaeraceae bacterium]
MNSTTRSTTLQALQLHLFPKALHPELFDLCGRRVVTQGAYELEAWILPNAHVIRFGFGRACYTELVTDREQGLPEGAAETFFCAGERDFEKQFQSDGITYMTSVQTEQLGDNLYAATYDELRDFGREVDGLSHTWDDGGPCLSMLDIQRYDKEVHVQAYHMIARGGIVLRTQSLFEHA